MESKVSPSMKKTFLIINTVLLSLGTCGGPLIMRLYYIHGGNRVWLTAFLETGGWPFTLLALIIFYFHRRTTTTTTTTTKIWYMKPRVFCAAAVVGVLTGLDDYLYSCGMARLPVSTAALIIASQLAFTAIFALVLVKQKFTSYTVNAVVLLTLGSGVLAMHTSSDVPEGESKREYVIGFVMTLGASLLYGFVLPLIELTYNKAKQAITFTLVVEMQLVICLFATIFCVSGMIANNDFKNINMESKVNPSMKKSLLIVNTILLSIGNCGGPLIMRLYFVNGGKRVWLSAVLETAGFPFIAIVLVIAFFLRRSKTETKTQFIYMRPRVFAGAAVVGILTGGDDYLYAYGVARLPVSTSSLIIASQLAFTAGFAYLLIKQKFTAFSINAVVLLTVGAGVLALHTRSDRPEGESKKEYVIGFVMTIGAAALYGFILPLVEFVYNKAKQCITYTLVLEFQTIMCLFATGFCLIGMIVNNDFKVIPREARDFELGESRYYVILVFSAILWQCFFLGAVGVIFCASSLLSGIIIAVLLPVTEVLAVIFYQEKFQAEKGVALILSLWGFVSYFYGEMKENKEKQLLKDNPELEMPPAAVTNV